MNGFEQHFNLLTRFMLCEVFLPVEYMHGPMEAYVSVTIPTKVTEQFFLVINTVYFPVQNDPTFEVFERNLQVWIFNDKVLIEQKF